MFCPNLLKDLAFKGIVLSSQDCHGGVFILNVHDLRECRLRESLENRVWRALAWLRKSKRRD